QNLLAQLPHQLLGFFPPLLSRQILDCPPMLQLRRLDHIKQRDVSAGMSGATRGIMDGDLKLLAFVDNDEEHSLLRGLYHLKSRSPIPSHQGQAPLNGRLASHPATMAVNTAIAP